MIPLYPSVPNIQSPAWPGGSVACKPPSAHAALALRSWFLGSLSCVADPFMVVGLERVEQPLLLNALRLDVPSRSKIYTSSSQDMRSILIIANLRDSSMTIEGNVPKCAHQRTCTSKLESQLILTLSHSLTYLGTYGHLLQQPIPPSSTGKTGRSSRYRSLGEAWLTPRRRLKGLDHDWIMMFRSCH
jgi:hypothetical protein